MNRSQADLPEAILLSCAAGPSLSTFFTWRNSSGRSPPMMVKPKPWGLFFRVVRRIAPCNWDGSRVNPLKPASSKRQRERVCETNNLKLVCSTRQDVLCTSKQAVGIKISNVCQNWWSSLWIWTVSAVLITALQKPSWKQTQKNTEYSSTERKGKSEFH